MKKKLKKIRQCFQLDFEVLFVSLGGGCGGGRRGERVGAAAVTLYNNISATHGRISSQSQFRYETQAPECLEFSNILNSYSMGKQGQFSREVGVGAAAAAAGGGGGDVCNLPSLGQN